ncbi:hypothetical protein [Streptomyces sp. NPDC088757]|uniref:hypothetical protein n=1 Tax=Streptomyces sp. NPDC088757 TaxID=3365889 RepID=UPI00380FF600
MVASFVVRRFVARGLLVNLSGNPKGTLHHPGQVAEVCARGTWPNSSPRTPRSAPTRPPTAWA